jgi:predicted RNase H-like HicB family nuclease
MMEYVYAAVFSSNMDGTFTITFPDLPGCISEGKDLPGASGGFEIKVVMI